jgi:hypothetical protein
MALRNTAICLMLVLQFAGAGACNHEPPAMTPISSSRKDRSMSTKQILFYENDQLTRTRNADEVPENIRYVEVNGQRVEVAKIVARTSGDETRTIEQYSADGVLLRRTLQHRPPTPPKKP